MRSFPLLLLIFTPGLTQDTDYCEDYAVCLERLEAKQRECLKLPVLEREDFSKSSPQADCLRKEKRRQQRGLGKLQLRRTEIIGDCISSHLDRAEDIMDPDGVEKCKMASEKMQILNEVIMNPKTFGKKNLKSKRKHVVIKQSHRVCRRVKKMLSKKCNQLSKCCSISTECEAKADRLSDQISQIRRDLRNPILSSECFDD
ncbi:unnamed protein product [Bursaphelenchus xylophilus]|uniref:(pine wood nematode) hypothetical protein n=1 Tax=Bursaphelenchus xylophilus TaxID=6326 RepID=A0A1I7RPV1_BURXY|nr:unnamed protein product [Bursaphelenchus xylophilus]CAG9096674.1 unnamed protein product [Bursaphelenchus xylophilus]